MRVASRNNAGFTLVDLMVVMAVVGVLVVVSLPALQAARARAATVACASNLRQIGVAMLVYVGDHDGVLPPARIVESPGVIVWPNDYWPYQLQPYLGIVPQGNIVQQKAQAFGGVFRDPGKKDWNPTGTGEQQISYAMNSFSITNNTGLAMRLAAIASPAKTTLVCDINDAYPVVQDRAQLYSLYNGLYPCQRHQGQDNVLFCDGHVQLVPLNGLNYDLTLP